MNENELERLRASEALRSKSDAREDRIVEQVRGLQQQMQEMHLQLRRLQSQSSAESSSCGETATSHANQESSESHHGDVTSGQSQDKQTVVTSITQQDPTQIQLAVQSTTARTNQPYQAPTPAADKAPPQKSTSSKTAAPDPEAGLAKALLAQQVPPLPNFSGGEQQQEEPFKEWLAQFELVAEVCGWSKRAKLIHLTTRLRGEAFAFYKSC